MAKKKAANKEKAEEKVPATLEDRIREQFGDNILVSGAHIVEQPQTIIPVSPQMDIMLNGGIPFGSFVIPTGPPKVGKTSLSLDLAGTAINIPTEFEHPRKLFYFKIEGRLPPRDLAGIHHLAPHIKDKVVVTQSERGRILTAEDFLDIAEQFINEYPGSVFIMDSMSQLCSDSRRKKDWHDGKAYRDDVPTMLSNFCKRISQVIPINESLFIGITHQISNTGFGFSPWAEASGNKVQYQVDVKLRATHNQNWKEKKEDVHKQGLEVFWECYAAPLQNGESIDKTSSKFRFGWGVDKHAELLDVATDLRIIKKGGSWFTFNDGKDDEIKVQGAPAARTVLIENPELSASIYAQFREMMGLCALPEETLKLCL